MVKTGDGSETLAGPNTYSGPTQVNQGTLVAAAQHRLGTTRRSTTVAAGATLGLQGGDHRAREYHAERDGYGGAGALQNLSGNNTLTGGSVTLATGSTIDV